ncbi:MAG: Scaffold-type E3 ligase [Thelocarpon impressellum]|nr:MAG: Scaffold-type E3 ligase [Thelocarpon impressellum]
MPTAYSGQQKAKIQQFVLVTSAADRVATKYLKANDWNVEQAADIYFRTQNSTTPGGASSGSTSALNKLFDKYRDAPADNPDTIGIEGAMKYLQDLKVQLDEIVVLAIGEALQSPTMGEFTRDGFVRGWKSLSADTIPKQQAAVSSLRTSLALDADLFRRVYRHTFQLARTGGQKAVALEAAQEYWRLLFSSGGGGGPAWNTATTPWLDWWLEFLHARWKKSVNRDMWNMTLEFQRLSVQREDMGWWDEQGAWPGVLDDFVAYVRERREVEGGKMEVE